MRVLRLLSAALLLGASHASAATYHEYRFQGILWDVSFDYVEYYDDAQNKYVFQRSYSPVGTFSTSNGNYDTLTGTYIGQRLGGHVSFWSGKDGVYDIECKIGSYSCDADVFEDNFEASFDGKSFYYSESGDSHVFQLSFDFERRNSTGDAYLATTWGWEAQDERYTFLHEGTDASVNFTKVYQALPVPLPLSAPLLLGAAFCFPLLRAAGNRKHLT